MDCNFFQIRKEGAKVRSESHTRIVSTHPMDAKAIIKTVDCNKRNAADISIIQCQCSQHAYANQRNKSK